MCNRVVPAAVMVAGARAVAVVAAGSAAEAAVVAEVAVGLGELAEVVVLAQRLVIAPHRCRVRDRRNDRPQAATGRAVLVPVWCHKVDETAGAQRVA